MQGFAWLGRVFFELALLFGAPSSPGIYDRLAKLVLFIVVGLSDFPSRLVTQHLDDVCACSPASSDKVDSFYKTYRETCNILGIKLADDSNPDKSFKPTLQQHDHDLVSEAGQDFNNSEFDPGGVGGGRDHSEEIEENMWEAY